MPEASRATIAALSLPPEEAIAFLLQKTSATTQHWTDVWQAAHSRIFMVAGAATETLVADFRREVEKALLQGTTLEEFRRGFDGIVERHGWDYNGGRNWRSRIIYETNLSTAYAAGRYAQQTAPATLAAFPFWQYVHSGSRHPRKQHLAWNGLVLRADDGFWQTHYPPNGWRCGCRVEVQSGRDLARAGRTGPDRAPPIETYSWTNKRTGETHQVPVGIDPSFDYNPGAAWRGPPEVPPGAAAAPPPGWPPRPPALPGGVSPDDFEELLRRAEARVRVEDRARGPLTEAFAPWFDGLVQRDLRSDGTRRQVGVLPEAVRQQLPDGFGDGTLHITSARAAHMARDSKAAADRALPDALLRRLPDLLGRPRAILRERATGDLILVLAEGAEEDREAIVVARPGMVNKARRGGDRAPFNGVVTAGLTPRSRLLAPQDYEVISGGL